MEREVAMEELEVNLVNLRRDLENRKLEVVKRAPCVDQNTLTNLYNVENKCFMLLPSDPAREILHMFVSQYRDNLCSNCYARITTLGSRPSSPVKSPSPSPR